MGSREPENDVDRIRLRIDASHHPETSPRFVRSIKQIVSSIRFEPSSPGAVGSRRFLETS